MSSMSPSTSPKLPSTSPSTSPPRTPVDQKRRPSLESPPSDDSSIIDDLSFDYVFDNEGNYVRLSKGSSSKSNHSSPPTPPDNLPLQPPDTHHKPSPPSIARRSSLSRSESAYPVLVTTTTAPKSDAQPPRSFQRVTSGPALLNNKARPLPRRVTMEESSKQRALTRTSRATDLLHEKENLNASDSEQGHEAHPTRGVPSRTGYSRSGLLDVHKRQIMPGPNRAGRVMMPPSLSSSSVRLPEYSIPETHSIDVISPEPEPLADDESAHPQVPSSTPFPSSECLSEAGAAGDTELIEPSQPSLPTSTTRQRSYGVVPSSSAHEAEFPAEAALTLSTGPRPRRSASLSDALSLHDPVYGYHNRQQQHLRDDYQNLRSGAVANDNTGGPRRVTVEERERELRNVMKTQDVDKSNKTITMTRIMIKANKKSRNNYYLLRIDTLGSPTVMEPLSRLGGASPSGNSKLGRSSPPGARVGRVSPPGKVSPQSTKGRISPSLLKPGRTSPPSRTTGRVSPASSVTLAKHRRSPTAPELALKDRPGERLVAAKAWGATDREEENGHRHERDKEREARRIQHQQQEQHQQMRAAPPPPVAAPIPSSQANRSLMVNKRVYARLDMIGKGGSSRVYRVFDSANAIYAIKRVALDKTDSETMSGYMNEIALLKRLAGNSRIIRLIDSEVKPGPGGSKGYLMLVMECGEVDLAKLISEAIYEPLDMVRVAGFWKQVSAVIPLYCLAVYHLVIKMLQAVHVIHEEKIVHSDLKPANFVIVKGQLKLIDFGIANAIANDTTNIQRDHQIGTVNFMSPEAIELPDGMRRLKVGRPSDIWSLGCILYQMIYGCPPFQHLNVYQKMKAIPDSAHVIDFPEYSLPLAPMPRSSNGAASGTATPPKRLDHLKTKVRGVVIDTMKGCLLRNPKERSTIPQLLSQNWLAMTDPELAPDETIVKLAPGESILKVVPDQNVAKTTSGDTFMKVGEEETVINPYYMRQLLEYGIKLGQSQNADMSPENLLREAEV
ncbi:hypothetical protein H0H87_005538 [Tephrocybe sp. NHM501043]|nr:hypothetical protein H0H87_005538 [Tephrocybe sp. NHM501043]